MQVFDAILNASLQVHTLWTVNDVTRKYPLKISEKTQGVVTFSLGISRAFHLRRPTLWSPYKVFFTLTSLTVHGVHIKQEK